MYSNEDINLLTVGQGHVAYKYFRIGIAYNRYAKYISYR